MLETQQSGRNGDAHQDRDVPIIRQFSSDNIGPLVRLNQLPRKQGNRQGSTGEQTQEAMQEMFGGLRAAGILSQAYHVGESVLLAWQRPQRGEQVQIIQGGETLVGDEVRGGDRVLNFPPGAKGNEVEDTQFAEDLSRFTSWVRVEGQRLPKSNDPSSNQLDEVKKLLGNGLSLEDELLPSFHGPFAFVLHATPVPPDDVDRRAEKAEDEWESSAIHEASDIKEKITAEAQDNLRRELEQAKSLGYWKVDILIGAEKDKDARRVAGIIAAGSMADSAHVYRPQQRVYESVGEALEAHDDADPEDSFFSSTPSLATLFSYPRNEIPGLRHVARPKFDVNVEMPDDVPQDRVINFGKVLDNGDFEAGDFSVILDDLTRHTLIVGMTGSGKSETVRSLLEEAAERGVTFTVIEAVKAEHRVMADRLANKDLPDKNKDVMVIHPGDPDTISAGFNPLEPEPGFPLGEHVGLIRSVFQNALKGDEEGNEIVARYLRLGMYGSPEEGLAGLYEELGWNLSLGESRYPQDPPYPTLYKLQKKMEDAVDKIKYGGEISNNMRGFMVSRIAGLRTGAPGQMLEGAHPMDFSRLLQSNTVIELEGIGDANDISFIMGATLIRMVEQLRLQERQRKEGGSVPLQHILVLEEAHHLFSKDGNADVVERFANILAEIRAYGIGIMILDQSPGNLHPSAIKNTGMKIVHNLPAQDDRDAVGATMKITPEQSDYLPTLTPGKAAAIRPRMDNPVLVEFPDPTDKPNRRDRAKSPSGLIERHPGCGTECQAEACTIRQLERTGDFLETTRAGRTLQGWADISVTSEILGLGDIVPDDEWCKKNGIVDFDTIRQLDLRTRECAIRDAVTKAVNGRAKLIIQHFDRDEMIDYFTQKINAKLDGQAEAEASPYELVPLSDDPLFLSTVEVYNKILKHVDMRKKAWARANPDVDFPEEFAGLIEKYPETEELEQICGFKIEGKTAREQMDFLHYNTVIAAELLFAESQGGGYLLQRALPEKQQKEDAAAPYRNFFFRFSMPASIARFLAGHYEYIVRSVTAEKKKEEEKKKVEQAKDGARLLDELAQLDEGDVL